MAPSVTSPIVNFHQLPTLADKRRGEKTSSKCILQNLMKKAAQMNKKVPTLFYFFPSLLVAASCFCACSPTASCSQPCFPWGLGEGVTAGARPETRPPALSNSKSNPAPDSLTFSCHEANLRRAWQQCWQVGVFLDYSWFMSSEKSRTPVSEWLEEERLVSSVFHLWAFLDVC